MYVPMYACKNLKIDSRSLINEWKNENENAAVNWNCSDEIENAKVFLC